MNNETIAASEQTSKPADGKSELNAGLCAADEHDYEYHEDTFGDSGVINGTGTERWMQCTICGDTQPATSADIPEYDYYW
jgi:hypothetical protein